MEGPDQSNPCAICLGAMGAGGGQAIFTAECSHTFHFSCISSSVAHGHLVCPLCNARWRDLPLLRPSQPPSMPPAPALPPQEPMHGVQPRQPMQHPTHGVQPLPRQEPMHGVQPRMPTQHPTHAVQPLPRQEPMHGVQPWQPRPRHAMHAVPPPLQPPAPEVFDDDDEVAEPPSGDDSQRRPAAASNGALVIKTHTEYSAIARDTSRDNFAVLVHVKAPGIIAGDAQQRAPLDLVTVLDVSGSMRGNKLALLKQAMRFVVDNLGPHDRLSVVSFSSGSRRVTRLLRMSDSGKGLALSAVESLTAGGGTNIAEGLRTAAKVLGDRRRRNAVSSVILLSDGQDNFTMPSRRAHGTAINYEALVPASFMAAGAGDRPSSIHTFGFGRDHDAAAMHVVAEATGGTFSFIENEAVIQDAFAQCIGGLLTVVVQEARVGVACGHPGVRIGSVKSGRYESRVDDDGRSASIRAGELYADEERRFLLFLAVPAADGETETTTLIKVSCSYRDAAGGADVTVTVEDTVVARPEHAADEERSVEVERERLRVEATEAISAAMAAAERGEHQEAAGILENRRRLVVRSSAARGGDRTAAALGGELRLMHKRVVNRESYARSGRAHALAALSMHTQQRGSTRELQADGGVEATSSTAAACLQMNSAVDDGGWDAMDMGSTVGGAGTTNAAAADGRSEEAEAASYATPAMRAMLLRSRMAREASAGPPPPQENKAGEEAGSSGEMELDKVADQ
ncbi:hypothetical protein ACP4OV_005212 [Aristida adscensionis]